jgi:hypothetical protein
VRRKRPILTYLPLVFAGVCAIAADDVQVISSPKSVLSIYSYGGSADTKNSNAKPTAALTDVARTSAISVTAPPPRPSSTPVVNNEFATVKKVVASTLAKASAASHKRPISGRAKRNMVSPAVVQPTGRVITIGWDRSPDRSVAGYQLYTGNVSRHYIAGRPLGDRTSIKVVLDQPIVYLAVSAYTADGFESSRSEELVLRADSQPVGPGLR